MFFDKSKGAFRAGSTNTDKWNTANIGINSFASGSNTKASGTNSTAMGEYTTASGYTSIAMGQSTASGSFSTAMGYQSNASGNYSTAMGRKSNASGEYSTVMGNFTNASGNASTAIGQFTTAKSFVETTIGIFNTNYTPNSTTTFNVNDRLFSIGNGISNAARSNALTILKNGNIGLGTDTPSVTLDVVGSIQLTDGNQAAGKVLTSDANGNATWQTPINGGEFTSTSGVIKQTTALTDDFVIGSATLDYGAETNRLFFDKSKGAFRAGSTNTTSWNTVNIGVNSFASGTTTKASGLASTAFGGSTTASNNYSTAFGKLTTASGIISSAMGFNSTASGNYSFVAGESNTASGHHSFAIGKNNIAPSYAETVIGFNSETYTPISTTNYSATDRVFSVGIGTATNVKKNALTILKNGNMGLGTATPSTTLDLVGSLQLTDGNQAAGKVLTSDVNGNATWQTPINGGEFTSTSGVIKQTTALTDDFVIGSATLDYGTETDRLFFDKSKGAFRAGFSDNTSWNAVNIGQNSFATGYRAKATNNAAFASGSNTVASGIVSTAMGTFSQATGERSTAMGYSTTAKSYAETTIGIFNTNYTPNSTTIFDANDRIFTVGNGTSSTVRSNALTVLKNGNTGIGVSTPNKPLTIKANINGDAIGLNDTTTNTQWHIRLQGTGKGDLGFTESGVLDNRLVLKAGGNIGIGTASPNQAKLVVNGFATTSLNARYFDFAGTNGVINTNRNLSAYFSNHIAAEELQVFSDKRIKDIKGLTNSQQDLETLSKIAITNYTLKDKVVNGNKTYKKVIAQQVKKIYPQAVTNNITRYIPNIYKLTKINKGWINLKTNLKVGDMIKLIFSKTEKKVKITAVSNNKFKVETAQEGKVFVYGKQVHDFHTVDYQAISMLNVSATQELLKRIETLEQEKNNLKSDLSSLQATNDSQNMQLKSLTKKVANLFQLIETDSTEN